MICGVVFATSVLTGLESGIVGIGLGAWALGLLLFIIEARRSATKRPISDLDAAEAASIVFIAATFAPDSWLDTVVRMASVFAVAVCELG